MGPQQERVVSPSPAAVGRGMGFKARTLIVALLAGCFAAVYATARLASPRIVEYVVEETLREKAAAPGDGEALRRRVRELSDGIRDPSERLRGLLALSAYLEKVQVADPAEVERVFSRQ